LLTINFDEDLVDVEGVAVATVVPLQASRMYGSELYAPKANGLPSDDDLSAARQRDPTVSSVVCIYNRTSNAIDVDGPEARTDARSRKAATILMLTRIR
jgi:hypothetical protein